MAEVVAVLAEGDRLAAKDDHGHLLVHGRAHGHGRVLGAHRRVEHHGGELAGGLRIPARHPHCNLLVTGREVLGDIARRVVRLGEKLPDRRPLRARRGEDSLDAHGGEHAQEGLRPGHSFCFHILRLSPGSEKPMRVQHDPHLPLPTPELLRRERCEERLRGLRTAPHGPEPAARCHLPHRHQAHNRRASPCDHDVFSGAGALDELRQLRLRRVHGNRLHANDVSQAMLASQSRGRNGPGGAGLPPTERLGMFAARRAGRRASSSGCSPSPAGQPAASAKAAA